MNFTINRLFQTGQTLLAIFFMQVLSKEVIFVKKIWIVQKRTPTDNARLFALNDAWTLDFQNNYTNVHELENIKTLSD